MIKLAKIYIILIVLSISAIETNVDFTQKSFAATSTNVKKKSDEYIIYSFFKNNSDTNTGIYVSTDGERINKINKKKLNLANLRDPSITFFGGWFLIAYTGYNPQDFKISKSKDLINWTTEEIDLNLYQSDYNKIWAPEFFVDGNKLYVLLSNREGADIKDIKGKSIPKFKPYITECLDIKSLKFSTPKPLKLDNGNKIDPSMIKHKGEYYMFIKNEYDKKIELWKSNRITGKYKKISNSIEPLSNTEGISIIKYNKKFYLYGDSFENDAGVYYFTTSTDLIKWSAKKKLKAQERIRHGSAYVVSNKKAKVSVKNFINMEK
ncbi:family 43 glycosylhydrolase [Planomicrobium sp. CPCC 101110]|uniref:family 43 glycosylhydrolase n=1 Tax=Planomicrobium sp. CPCC 101110 TaxID=2599619 RepID=UPI0011B500C1|nr:family 43 glycosylhydrolase [Planomicrobium sp. CPCC 101110]TWT27725.1 family 43 glycosylhydrolase [Planomicrobium sp. CPCC 101110]